MAQIKLAGLIYQAFRHCGAQCLPELKGKKMIWLVEKKIFRHILDMGFERVQIHVRVKFEFEVVEGSFVPDTLTKEILYNQGAILKHYPKTKISSLDSAIEEMVEDKIMEYIRQCGLLPDESHDAI